MKNSLKDLNFFSIISLNVNSNYSFKGSKARKIKTKRDIYGNGLVCGVSAFNNRHTPPSSDAEFSNRE